MHNTNKTISKRPFTVLLYDRTESGKKSNEIIAAELTASHFPYVHISGVFIDTTAEPRKRPAFDKMMRACDAIPVDCIIVPNEECLFGDLELMCMTMKAMADRSVCVFDLDTGRIIRYDEIWESLVMFADTILDIEDA